MKKERFFLTGMLAIALVFAMTVAGCKQGGGDLVKVDKSLPNIKDVPSFEGTFVSNQTQGLQMVEEAIGVLGSFASELEGPSPSVGRSAFRSMSRGVTNEPVEETYENEKIAEGVWATGYVKGYFKEFTKYDDGYTVAVGDFMEMSARIKVALDFKNASGTKNGNTYKFNGKYYLDEDVYMKEVLKSVGYNSNYQATIKLNADNGYAFSVSKGGQGLKFVVKLTFKLDGTFDSATSSEADILNKASVKVTIDVYDNNSNTPEYSKVYTDFVNASKFLGGMMDYLDN